MKFVFVSLFIENTLVTKLPIEPTKRRSTNGSKLLVGMNLAFGLDLNTVLASTLHSEIVGTFDNFFLMFL